MNTFALIASVIVGCAFVIAGGSKIVAGVGWPEQAAGLGAPLWVIPFVPWVEIVIGAMLIVQVARPWPAVAAMVVLIVFTALIAFNLSKGRRPPCACFGAWSAKPIGAGHLVRNAILIALTVVALR